MRTGISVVGVDIEVAVPFWLLRSSHHGYETGTVRECPVGGFLGKLNDAGMWLDLKVLGMGRAWESMARQPAKDLSICGARETLALWGGEGARQCNAERREAGHRTLTLRLSQLFISEKIQHTNAAKTARTEPHYNADRGRLARPSEEWFGVFTTRYEQQSNTCLTDICTTEDFKLV